MFNQPNKTPVYSGLLDVDDLVPAKLAELVSTANRLALSAARAIERNRLTTVLSQWITDHKELEATVNAQMPSDAFLQGDFDLTELRNEYRVLPYVLTFEKNGRIFVHRSPYFTFAPSNSLLMDPTPGSRPCYALPADWVKSWRKPLFHAPSINAKELVYAHKPSTCREKFQTVEV